METNKRKEKIPDDRKVESIDYSKSYNKTVKQAELLRSTLPKIRRPTDRIS